MVMCVPAASWFDPETEQCMQRIVHAPDSVTDVVKDVLGLRSSRGHPAVEFTGDEGSSLSVATDGRRAFLVWTDTLGETFHSVGSSGGPLLIFDYFGSARWSAHHARLAGPDSGRRGRSPGSVPARPARRPHSGAATSISGCPAPRGRPARSLPGTPGLP